MNSKSKYSLQRTMIIYFLLIGFASLLVGVEFLTDTNSPELKKNLISNFEKYSDNQMEIDKVFAPIDELRNKALLMIGIIMFVMIIVLTMFIKNITGPLQHMIEISKKITKGDLSQTITIDSDNELAELGNTINEMSSNLQEIILLSKNMCLSGKDFVDRTSFIMDRQQLNTNEIRQVGNEIMNLKKEIDMLNELMDFFSFYTVEK